jgi:hypothetical protein
MAETTSQGALAEGIAAPNQALLREQLEQLERIHRPSASAGEREAAEWIVERFADLGVESRIEVERAHGTYWWPLGIGAAAGVAAGLAGLRGRRLLGAAIGLAGAAAIADDFPPKRRRLRRLLTQRDTFNVVAELGPTEAQRTVVLVAHHDTAHAGLVFHPAFPHVLGEHFPEAFERNDTSPPLMFPVVGGPLVGALGAAVGSRVLSRVGIVLGAGTVAAMADIGARDAVPGANDNGTAVVLLIAIARALAERPTDNVRVMLVSTGSEESFSEGMKAFGERHFPRLPREDTFFLCLDTVGSPHLNVLRGEGFLKMHEYPARSLALLDGLAEELGIWLFPNLRLHNGTDGLEALAAGYETASLCSCTELKQPANYHWPSDVAENVNYDTFADAVRLSEAVIRRLDERWL